MSYIMLDSDSLPVDTDREIATAQAALYDLGIESAVIYAGEPDGSGDSCATNGKIFGRSYALVSDITPHRATVLAISHDRESLRSVETDDLCEIVRVWSGSAVGDRVAYSRR